MRVLTLNYEYPPLGGGAARATEALLGEFTSMEDLDFHLVTSSTGPARTERPHPNCRIDFLDIGKRGSLHYQSNADLLRYAWRARRRVRELVRRERFDVCHAFFGIPCGALVERLGPPFIVSLRGSDVPFYNPRFRTADRLFFQRLSRRIWRRAAAVVANSEGLRSLALETAPEQAISVIPNGVDAERFRPGAPPPAPPLRVLCVSRLIARKGIDDLLRALALLPEPVQLTLAGSGAAEGELRALAAGLGFGDGRVRFLGVVEPERVAEVYRGHHVFVLPSLNEGMSNTLLEALASGLPIVATKTGGTAELLEEGRNGFAVAKRAPEAIAGRLRAYLERPDLIAEQGAAARATALRFTWRRTAEEYARLYHACARER